jgi:hypothetical protein
LHYRLSVSSREAKPGFWLARATIQRLDSDEEIDGVQVSGKSEEQALAALVEPLREHVKVLPSVPHQWGKTELHQLLADYREFNDGLTSILVGLQKSLSAGTLTESELHDAYWKAREKAVQGGVALAARLSQLTEQDRVELMTASDEAYRRQEDTRNLDDLDSRDALFAFIASPSDAVLKAHETHLRRWDESSQ